MGSSTNKIPGDPFPEREIPQRGFVYYLKRKWHFIGLSVLIVLAVTAGVCLLKSETFIRKVEEFVLKAAPDTPARKLKCTAGTIAVMTLLLPFGVPTSACEIVAGFAFGWFAILPCTIGKVTGSLVIYAAARLPCLQKIVAALANRYSHIGALRKLVEKEPLKYSFMVQMAYLPLLLKNLLVAFLGVSLMPFLFSMLIATCPYSIAFISIGNTSAGAFEALGGKHKPTKVQHALRVIGVLITLAIPVLISTAVHRRMGSLDELEEKEEDVEAGVDDDGDGDVEVVELPTTRSENGDAGGESNEESGYPHEEAA